MATVAAPRRRTIPALTMRVPARVAIPIFLVVLVAASVLLRTRAISGSFWMDEGLSVGIASHPLAEIPGVLHNDGSPPFYYVLLHLWMDVAGRSETATHGLSLLFSMLAIPVGLWAGWSLFGRRAGVMLAALCALNPFLSAYGQETRMYSLMALLSLVTATAFLHAFVYGRRRYLVLFALGQALMLYTHSWGIFFGVGALAAIAVIWSESDDRRRVLLDAALAFGGAALLFLPWVPTLLFQSAHTAAPWDKSPRFGAPVQISRGLLGGDRSTVALLLGAGLGISAVLRLRRRAPEHLATWAMIAMPVVGLATAWILSQFTPAWVLRYFAAVLGPILLLSGLGLARAKKVGVAALVLVLITWLDPKQYTAKYKSDVRDIGADVRASLKPGDLVLVGQPEQVPLVWYYMPAGLRYSSTLGPTADPRAMDWVDALSRYRAANPHTTLEPMLAGLRRGQRVLLVRPITDGADNWEAPWTTLVRRRSAQWGQILASDPHFRTRLAAPQFFRGATTVGNSAVLYEKVS